MPYDLYGVYYPTEREAIAAETAQMAEIDAARAEQKADQAMAMAESRYHENAQREYELWDRIISLTKRLDELEKRVA